MGPAYEVLIFADRRELQKFNLLCRRMYNYLLPLFSSSLIIVATERQWEDWIRWGTNIPPNITLKRGFNVVIDGD